jgi:Protein of unknown function (DUF2442)
MNSSLSETRTAALQFLTVTDDSLIVDLVDGRTISVPLAWYPRLLHGQPEERNNWRLIGQGEGIHWPDLDEDISAENLLFGQPSGESQRSLSRWLETRSGPQQASSQHDPA